MREREQGESGGVRVFFVVWAGQLVSLAGSGLTSFVLGLYVYTQTRSVTQFTLILLSGALPRILFSPAAGMVADRWDRRVVMLVSDVVAGLSVLAVALLVFAQRLTLWEVYVAAGVGAACGAFQNPAYIAATTMLVPGRLLSRAGGLLQLGLAAQEVLAPLLAAALLGLLGLAGVLTVDVATFVVAVATLMVVRFPAVAQPTTVRRGSGGAWGRATLEAWQVIAGWPGLPWLLALFAVASLLNGFVAALLYPLVLAFAPAATLGLVVAAAGTGLVASSLAMSAWSGPRRRVEWVLGAQAVFGAGMVLIGLRPSAVLITLGAAAAHLALPAGNVINQVIWQRVTPAEAQGRVFAVRQMVGRAAALAALALAGPLADGVFNPLLAPGGRLVGSVGWLFGVGPGRGSGVLLALLGALGMLVAVVGALAPRLRGMQTEAGEAMPVARMA